MGLHQHHSFNRSGPPILIAGPDIFESQPDGQDPDQAPLANYDDVFATLAARFIHIQQFSQKLNGYSRDS
jgi:hypothetical protein